MSSRLRLALGLTVVGVAAGLWAWAPWQAEDAAPAWRLGQIEQGPLTATVSASGTLNARVTVQVGSQVSGQIRELLADFNAPVKQGQVIARLDPETFLSRVSQAEADLYAARSNVEVARGSLNVRQAEVAKAQIALDEATRSLERKRNLVDKAFISPAELDTAKAAADSAAEQLRLTRTESTVAGAQVESALAGVSQREALLRQARLELERTVIRSPVDGVVIQRSVDVGQTVAASLQAPVLFVIAQDLSRMELNIAVDEADVGRVQVDQPVSFTVDAFPGRRFKGAVSQIRKAAQTSNNVVTYSVMAEVDNPDQALLPGMTANARIVTEARESVLKVPNEALRFRPTGPDGAPIKLEVKARENGPGIPGRVWRPGANGQPEALSLRLGVSDGKETEILKGEVSAGTAIILGQDEAAGSTPKRPFGRVF